MLKQLLLGMVMLASATLAQAQPAAGVAYRELPVAQPTDAADKLEVIDFFWFGCPHCYHFEPVLNAWVKKLPKDVQFRRVPAIFNDEWAQGARAYYALEAIGEESRLHKALFDAVHQGPRLNVANEAALTEWLVKQGVDAKKFATAYRSFSVEGKIKRAAQLTQAYKIEGVPAVAVNGKYVVITDNISPSTNWSRSPITCWTRRARRAARRRRRKPARRSGRNRLARAEGIHQRSFQRHRLRSGTALCGTRCHAGTGGPARGSDAGVRRARGGLRAACAKNVRFHSAAGRRDRER